MRRLIFVMALGIVFMGCGGGGGHHSGGSAPPIVVPPPGGGTPVLSGATDLNRGFIGTTYNLTFAATGGTAPYTFDLIGGTLPTGLTLATNGSLTGTPTTAGTFTPTVRATDAANSVGTKQYTIRVTQPIRITTTAQLPSGKVGTPYSNAFNVVSGGLPPYRDWRVDQGTLPAGLSIDVNSGTISGTPTASGTFTFRPLCGDSGGDPGAIGFPQDASGNMLSSVSLTIAP